MKPADKPADQLSGIRMQVYSAAWCGDCRRLKAWLEANKVVYETVPIDEREDAAAFLEAQTGKRAIPFVLVNGTSWVRGYHKESPMGFDPTLFVKEIVAAGRQT